jgi:dihydrodipicolinate synthase/N-acetylneuraminate lyase
MGLQVPSLDTLANVAASLEIKLWELFQFGHLAAAKEVQDELRKLIRELDEGKLRLVMKVVQSMAR